VNSKLRHDFNNLIFSLVSILKMQNYTGKADSTEAGMQNTNSEYAHALTLVTQFRTC
jgi:hypothetical protein